MNPLTFTRRGKRLFLALAAVSSFALLAGCGSSSGGAPINPQGFSNSSLSGTYVFSFSGTDVTNNNVSFFAVVGALVADGKGNFSSGTMDINDPSLAAALNSSTNVFPAESATGTYSVTSDGRGSGKITVTINGTGVPFGLDFVLTSTGGLNPVSSHGLITRFDGNGTGSGTIDLQTTGITQSSLQGSYAFGFSGIDPSSNLFATVGAFSLDASGNATGLQDFNDNGVSPGEPAGLTLSGNVTVGSPVTTAALNTSSGDFTFDVYIVDNTHLKFIETDELAILAGDAFTQQTSIPAGVYAYTMEGLDNNTNPLAMAGFFTSDGTSAISAGLEEFNDFGATSSVTGFSGSYTPFTGGRTELTLNNFYNGNGALTGPITFAAYPSSGGIQLLEVDNSRSGAVTGGVALAQGTTTTIATSQGYGLNLTAVNFAGVQEFEEDDIAQFTVSANNTFKGVEDINDEGSGARDQGFSGTLTPDSSIPGHGSAKSNQFNFNYYVANNGSTVLILETDNVQLGVGSFLLQNTSQVQPVGGLSRLMIARSKAGARPAAKTHNK